MTIETTKMSSKGQIVIPQDMREELGLEEGTLFVVIGTKDTIFLKKLEMPSKEKLIKDFQEIAKEGRKRAEKLGIKSEKDINEIIHKSRKK